MSVDIYSLLLINVPGNSSSQFIRHIGPAEDVTPAKGRCNPNILASCAAAEAAKMTGSIGSRPRSASESQIEYLAGPRNQVGRNQVVRCACPGRRASLVLLDIQRPKTDVPRYRHQYLDDLTRASTLGETVDRSGQAGDSRKIKGPGFPQNRRDGHPLQHRLSLQQHALSLL